MKLSSIGTAGLLGTLNSEPVLAQSAPKNTVEYIAENYYEQQLQPDVVTKLCEMNKAGILSSNYHDERVHPKVIGSCNDLRAGSLVVLPTVRELNWAMCDVDINPTFCRATYKLLNASEQADPSYKALPTEAKQCVANLRSHYPTAPLINLVVGAKGIADEHRESGWSGVCDSENVLVFRQVPSNFARYDNGDWEVTTMWGN